jgi:hypothetical protein
MICVGAENKRRKHGPDGVRGRLRFWPVLMGLEARTLLSTFTVNSAADDGSTGTLRWAINQANANGQANTITFSSLFNAPQRINLVGGTLELTATAKTTIAGPGADRLTVDSSSALTGSDFEVTKGAVAALSGLTITGGLAIDGAGGVLNEDGHLTMINVVVRGNAVGSNERQHLLWRRWRRGQFRCALAGQHDRRR